MSADLALKFVVRLDEDDTKDPMSLMLAFFKFADSSEEMQEHLKVDDRVAVARNVLTAAIRDLLSGNPKKRDEYLMHVNAVLGDSFDFGSLVSTLMKLAESAGRLRHLNGSEKKQLVKEIFSYVVSLSSMDETQKRLAEYAFNGVLEAIIWAKHGGLKEAKRHCRVLCA